MLWFPFFQEYFQPIRSVSCGHKTVTLFLGELEEREKLFFLQKQLKMSVTFNAWDWECKRKGEKVSGT